jgi:lysophospholipase L1-like esterase
MKSRGSMLRRGTAVAAVVAIALTVLQAQKPGRRIAVFGSSVAFGTGDDLGKEGYTGRLREMLAPRGWEVLNQSRGGDNTKTMAPRFAPAGEPDPRVRYLLPVNPNYALLGLSLGNEGIRQAEGKAGKDAIYAQFEAGMRGFVERSREHHIVPVITLCYTRNDFTAVEYEYTRRMNLLINSWDVPSVNFLGAVDDGEGKWAKGFWHDSLHPNAAGHAEMTMTVVPSLFDAIEQGKPLPKKSTATGFAQVSSPAAITFTPESTMHPFALTFSARAQSDGTIATISGSTLTVTSSMKREERARGGTLEFEASTVSTAVPFTASIGVRSGTWTYTSAGGQTIASPVKVAKADAQWHQVTLSHYTARGETLFFVDGALAGKTNERLETNRFALGGSADLKDLMIYRSALNADEVAALRNGTLLQTSLEVYAPLADTKIKAGAPLENRAQSLSAAKAGAGIVNVEK